MTKVKNCMIYLILGVFCIIAVFPFYWLIITSAQPVEGLFKYPPLFTAQSNIIENYYHYIKQSEILLWLGNTFGVSLLATLISTFLAIPAAYSISRFMYKGRTLVIFIVLLTQMLPLVLLIIPIYITFSQLQFTDNLSALVLLYTVITMPIGIWFLKGFFDAIPKELEEAAIIDGCSRLQALIRILIPLLVPGIIATATWSFIIAWDEYLFAYTLIDSQNLYVISIGLASYIGQYSTEWNEIMTGAVLATLPIVILFMFFQKYMVSGLTAGSVKG
ncbi:carbohydrate ABC transporter permease [Paenibacillus sp. J2TS4]|uniref:carbohydrate ABC transporter permease n=1 Tax=Paenibacillus sp. J2TS4 TaxID=2807194 RepID=UPI001B199406|nr:carbohydrate ABC transporter permease [Paenibacillus sp. J2TS4]GIP30954.1 sugar ABC transporter [Paenibacillus sp. J2TS4]